MIKTAIIGGGPAGYVAAIRLQQYGIDVALFEKERLGGVCLNYGCIPTKALVKVADLFAEMNQAAEFGLSVENPRVDYQQVWLRKNRIVDQLVSGVEFIFKKLKIIQYKQTVLSLEKISDSFLIKTSENEYQAERVILATGSKSKELPSLKFDKDRIMSSDHILDMQSLPAKLTIIGGGVIGCEFASIYHQLGVEVEIIEFLPNLIATEDQEISKRLAMAFKKKGIKLHLNKRVESYTNTDSGLHLLLSDGTELITEKVLLSVGRAPVCELEFKNFEIEKKDGFIRIDDNFQTNVPGIFAIGDVTGKMLLAHAASKQGLALSEFIKSQIEGEESSAEKIDYKKIPACTFTNPEIGSVGYSEQAAREKYEAILVGKFPFTANGKALSLGDAFGFVKTIADAKTRKIIGMHIIGPQATELIAQGGILLGTDASMDDLKKIVFAHPTLSEAVMESFEDLENMAIHKI